MHFPCLRTWALREDSRKQRANFELRSPGSKPRAPSNIPMSVKVPKSSHTLRVASGKPGVPKCAKDSGGDFAGRWDGQVGWAVVPVCEMAGAMC